MIQLLATALLTPDGQKKVLKAFDSFRVVTGEERRFETLILQITVEPHDPPFQVQSNLIMMGTDKLVGRYPRDDKTKTGRQDNYCSRYVDWSGWTTGVAG